MEMLNDANVPFAIVLTKADKIKTQTDKGKGNADICRACQVCGLWLVYEIWNE
jgi:GTP-binding protein EngB required for normal cell division